MVIAVVAVLVVAGVLVPLLVGVVARAVHRPPGAASGDQIALPAGAPAALAGSKLDPGGLQQNADWTTLSSQIRRAAVKTTPDSRFGLLPLRPSVLGGQIDCPRLTTTRVGVGQCWWVSPTYVVLVTTFSSNLRLDRALTEQIVTDLHVLSGAN